MSIYLPHCGAMAGGGPLADAGVSRRKSEGWRGKDAAAAAIQQEDAVAVAFPLHHPLSARLLAGLGGRSPSRRSRPLGGR
jgi:hypothetical protein